VIGPSDAEWVDVVRAAARTAADWARREQFHFYSDLAEAVNEEVDGAALEAHGFAMNHLLYDIVMTARAFAPDAPMLSAVVVLKDASKRQPGQGFWELGKELGRYNGSRDEADQVQFWSEELAASHSLWTAPKLREFDRWMRSEGVVTYA
jgi:hypothetical protein